MERGRGRGRGNHRGGGNHGDRTQQKTIVIDLVKYQDQKIRVKIAGGREVVGLLKGYDQLMNLVLDDVEEFLRDAEGNISDQTRSLGLVVLRGPNLVLISPVDGSEEIANPFLQDQE